MLVRCERCGKPVFVSEGRRAVECSYCYTTNVISPDLELLTPDDVDWKAPIVELAISMPPGSEALRVMRLVGEDVPQARLDLCHREAARQEQIIAEARGLVGRRARIEQIDEMIDRVAGIPESRQVREVMRLLHQAREVAMQRARIRRIDRICGLVATLALCLVFGVAFIRYRSMNVWQPEHLKEASALVEAEDYAAADEVYRQLLNIDIFINQDVRSQAFEGHQAMLEQWALELIEQGESEEAMQKLALLLDDDRALEIRREMAEKLADDEQYEDAILLLEGDAESADALRELRNKYFDQLIDAGSYEEALAVSGKLSEDSYGSKGLTLYDVYVLWANQAIESGERSEMLKVNESIIDVLQNGSVDPFTQAKLIGLATKLLQTSLEN